MVRRSRRPGRRSCRRHRHDRRRRARPEAPARAQARRGAGSSTTRCSRHLLARYLVPQPRNALAEAVRAHASAAMDVSDGLVGDLGKLCRASGVGAEIEVARVPLSEAAQAALDADADADRDRSSPAATITRSSRPFRRASSKSFRAAARAAGVPVTEIGRVAAGQGARVPRRRRHGRSASRGLIQPFLTAHAAL